MTEKNTPNPKNETPASDTSEVGDSPVVEEVKEAVVEETKEAGVEEVKEAVAEESKEAGVEEVKEAVVEEVKEVAVKETPKKEEPVEAKAPKKKVEAKPVPKPTGDAPDGHWWWGTGRRKAAVARVRIRPGNGEFQVNKRQLTDFFSEIRDHQNILTVLDKTNTKGTVDVFVNTNGGGFTGQAGAIILGLGRALAKYDPSLESILRDNGYLSRDPRKVERKKPGQPGARKRFQFSKR